MRSRSSASSDRVEVLEGRAEDWARDAGLPGDASTLVTARSFAGPAVTAEIAAGLVRVGGIAGRERAARARTRTAGRPDGSRELGFGPAEPVVARGAHFVVLRKVGRPPPDDPPAGRDARPSARSGDDVPRGTSPRPTSGRSEDSPPTPRESCT